MVDIATTPQYALTSGFITKTFKTLAFNQCTRGPFGMCSFGGCILGNFKIGNIWIPAYLQMTRLLAACSCSVLMTHPTAAHFQHSKFIRTTKAAQLSLSLESFLLVYSQVLLFLSLIFSVIGVLWEIASHTSLKITMETDPESGLCFVF